jgi:anti-sigma-K factor RskA
MIDERIEELAALHALDLLEGAERDQFAAAVAADPALAQLVDELRAASATLAHLTPAAEPPAALKARVLASVESSASPDTVIRPPLAVFRALLPWAVAAGFALLTGWLGTRYVAIRSEAALLREQTSLADVALKAARNDAEAAQLLARRQLDTLSQQLTATQLQITDRDRQVASLTQRVDALSGAAQDLGRQLGAAKGQIAKLTNDLKTQGDLANLKITALASLLKNSPEAIAVAVWNPEKQEGVLKVDKLPALAADKDYQLWVVDPQYPNPVDGGVFTVDPQTGRRRGGRVCRHARAQGRRAEGRGAVRAVGEVTNMGAAPACLSF